MKIYRRNLAALHVALTFFTIAAFSSLKATIMTEGQLHQYKIRHEKESEILRKSNNSSRTNDQPTVDKLNKLEVSGVQWANVDIQSALNELAAKSKEVDPSHVGIRFSVLLSPKTQKDVLDRTMERNVCLIFRGKKNFFDLLLAISGQTNLSFKVQKNAVTFMPWESDAYISLEDLLASNE